MVEVEQWQFWTARASVLRVDGRAFIELRGVVTAAVYEGLHMRLGFIAGPGRHLLLLDWPALLAVTNISAVEAAVRGAPAQSVADQQITLCVPEPRLQWAREHCEFMRLNGFLREAAQLPVLDPACRPVAAVSSA